MTAVLGALGWLLLTLLKIVGILLLIVLVLLALALLCPFCADFCWENGVVTIRAGVPGITLPVFRWPAPPPAGPEEPKGFFGIAAIRFNGRERGGGPPGNGVHAFGGEPVQRREDRGGIVQTPHPVIQIPQNGQCAALFLRERHLNPLSSGPCRR